MEDHEAKPGNESAFYRFSPDFHWEGVAHKAYKERGSNFADIVRQVIIGDRGESCLFDLRYFEIAPGGFSSFEKHHHEHVVICVRGRGEVHLADSGYELGYLDIIYISPDTPHQLRNEGNEAFGFFCLVNRERDEPIELEP